MITRIRYDFGGRIAEHELGPVTALIGPNGAGKTTALHALQYALTDRLAWPLGGASPARSAQDVAAALLPPGPGRGEVTLDMDGETITRRISRSEAGNCESKPVWAAYTGPQRVKPVKAVLDAAITARFGLDPLAYSLAPWLALTGPQRISDMLLAATLHMVTEADLDEAGITDPGARGVALSQGAQAAADGLGERVTMLARAQREVESRAVAAATDLARLPRPIRPRQQVAAEMETARAELVQVEAALGTHAQRLEDRQRAGQRHARALLAAQDVGSEWERATSRAAEREAEWERLRAVTYPAESFDGLLLDLDEAEARLELVRAHAEERQQQARSADTQARDARGREDSARAALHAIATAIEVGGWCGACTARLHATRATHELAITDAVDTAAGLAATAAMLRDNAAEAERVMLEVVVRAQDAQAALDAARARNAGAERRQEQDASRLRELDVHLQRVADLRSAADKADDALDEAAAELARCEVSTEVEQLRARATGLREVLRDVEADSARWQAMGAAEARQVEARAEMDRLTGNADALKIQRAALLDLRDRMLREGLAPLDGVADALYCAVTGGHLRFAPDRGGVDVDPGDGCGWRPLERCSTGERALAAPSIAIALQRARGCERPTLLLDSLESLDKRIDLVRQLVTLHQRGDLHQAILAWTGDDLAAEQERAAGAGALVVEMGT